MQRLKTFLVLGVGLAIAACTSHRPIPKPPSIPAVVHASGGKKITYTYPLQSTNRIAYTVEFAIPDATSEWLPAMWLILDHKEAGPAYQFMLFQDEDGEIRPEIRLLDVEDKREHFSIEPNMAIPPTDAILVELEICGSRITARANGKDIDVRDVPFPVDQLRVGFSSGTFSVKKAAPSHFELAANNSFKPNSSRCAP